MIETQRLPKDTARARPSPRAASRGTGFGMDSRSSLLLPLLALLVGLTAAWAGDQPPDTLATTPSWQPPNAEQVRTKVTAWLDEHKVDDQTRAKADKIWSVETRGPTGSALLEQVCETFALGDARARRLVETCSKPRSGLRLPDVAWLGDPKTPPLEANNLRLLYGRWLAHQRLFDESLEQLADLQPADVVDPASLLFYRSVAHHRLVDYEAGLETIEQLLEGPEAGPRRYKALAGLMKEDLKDLKEDSLDHIDRRMQDIERRLDLGRAGSKVRKIQDGVVESLDKLIKKIEEQLQQQQCGGGGGSNQPSSPAPDSRILGGSGPGEVTKRDIGSHSGWGDLPPKERQKALQQIGRDFPAHYRDVVEQYFRKIASEENP